MRALNETQVLLKKNTAAKTAAVRKDANTRRLMLKPIPNVDPSIKVKPTESTIEITMAITAENNSEEDFLFSVFMRRLFLAVSSFLDILTLRVLFGGNIFLRNFFRDPHAQDVYYRSFKIRF